MSKFMLSFAKNQVRLLVAAVAVTVALLGASPARANILQIQNNTEAVLYWEYFNDQTATWVALAPAIQPGATQNFAIPDTGVAHDSVICVATHGVGQEWGGQITVQPAAGNIQPRWRLVYNGPN